MDEKKYTFVFKYAVLKPMRIAHVDDGWRIILNSGDILIKKCYGECFEEWRYIRNKKLSGLIVLGDSFHYLVRTNCIKEIN